MVWIDKLHNGVKRICFNVEQGNRKKTLPSNGCTKKKKLFINNMNLVDSNYHWMSTKRGKKTQKLNILRKRLLKLKYTDT